MASAYDYFRAATLVGGFGYVARQQPNTWLLADSILWATYAICIFLCPETMLSFGGNTIMMNYLLRLYASVLLAIASMWYFSRRTIDSNVIGAMLWTRILASIALLVMIVYTFNTSPAAEVEKLSPRMMLFDFVGIVMLLLTSIYQLTTVQYHVGGFEKGGHVTLLLRLNFLVLFLSGLLNMAFPSWVIPFKTLSKMEVMVTRLIGGGFFGLAFTAWLAAGFRFNADRISFFLSEMLACALMFLSLNIAHFKDGLFEPKEVLIMHLATIPWLIVLLGLYLLWKDKNTVHYSEPSYFLRSKSE